MNGFHLGYRYDDSPIVLAGRPRPRPTLETPHLYPDRAGRAAPRAPHVVLPDGRSTLDLFGAWALRCFGLGPDAPSGGRQ